MFLEKELTYSSIVSAKYPTREDLPPINFDDALVISSNILGEDIEFHNLGRRDFEFGLEELKNKDFFQWQMQITLEENDTSSALAVTRFETKIRLLINETAYLHLDPYRRITGSMSDVLATLACLTEDAYKATSRHGIVIYLAIPMEMDQFWLKQEKILLPGKELQNNSFFETHTNHLRNDLISEQLYEVDDRFIVAFPEDWKEYGDILANGDITPQVVIFSNFQLVT